jgi:hypothetical protein
MLRSMSLEQLEADADALLKASALCPKNSEGKVCSEQGSCSSGICKCEKGFQGLACEDKACPNDCNDKGTCDGATGKCLCLPEYMGDDCSQEAKSMCPKQCSGHGECDKSSGTCSCFPGYTGPGCALTKCPNDCSDHGICDNFKCQCNPGYDGFDCSIKRCADACDNHGRCDGQGHCICEIGWKGENCETEACLYDCSNHGSCSNQKCTCDEGWGGEFCNFKACPEGCDEHGICNEGECICSDGYWGHDCSKKVCNGIGSGREDSCSGKGECQADGTCNCEDGWDTVTGCATKSCHKDCFQHGTCDDGACVCDEGFAAPYCEVHSCPKGCGGSDHGVCDDGSCLCKFGWSGEDCMTATCADNCNSNGVCHDGICLCNQGFRGSSCSDREVVEGNGRISDDGKSVICNEGWTGDSCELPDIQLCPNECSYHGKCLEGMCECSIGWRGTQCDERVVRNIYLRVFFLFYSFLTMSCIILMCRLLMVNAKNNSALATMSPKMKRCLSDRNGWAPIATQKAVLMIAPIMEFAVKMELAAATKVSLVSLATYNHVPTNATTTANALQESVSVIPVTLAMIVIRVAVLMAAVIMAIATWSITFVNVMLLIKKLMSFFLRARDGVELHVLKNLVLLSVK